jgi:site-specific recombinase XerD
MQPKPENSTALVVARSGDALARSGAMDPLSLKRREVVGMYRSKLTTTVSRETTLKSLQLAVRMLCARWWPDLYVDTTGHGDVGWISAGDFPWELLEAKHLDGLRDDLRGRAGKSGDPAASTSINKHVSTVRKLLRIGFRENLVSADVVQRVREVEGAKGKRPLAGRALGAREVKRLLDACDVSTTKGLRDFAIVSVLYRCALRRDEIGLLRIGSYDGASFSVLGKGGHYRPIPVRGATAEAVDAWLSVRKTVGDDKKLPIFTSLSPGTGCKITNARLSSQAVFKIIKELVERAELKKTCSPHDLRRTFASDFLEMGGDIVALQRLLGHAFASTTARYDRRHEQANVASVDMLEAFRKKKLAKEEEE